MLNNLYHSHVRKLFWLSTGTFHSLMLSRARSTVSKGHGKRLIEEQIEANNGTGMRGYIRDIPVVSLFAERPGKRQ